MQQGQWWQDRRLDPQTAWPSRMTVVADACYQNTMKPSSRLGHDFRIILNDFICIGKKEMEDTRLPHDRVADALETFARSLALKSESYRRIMMICLAYAAFLATAIVQYDLLSKVDSIWFKSAAMIAFLSAVLTSLISALFVMVIDEQAASITEQIAGVKLGFAGDIKSINDGVEAHNNEIRYFNNMGILSLFSQLTYSIMGISTLVAVLAYASR